MSDDDWSLKGKLCSPHIEEISEDYQSGYECVMRYDKYGTWLEKDDIDTLREKLIEDFRSRCWRGRHIGLGDIEQIINKRFGVD